VSKKSDESETNADEKEVLAEAICDIFSQAIKIPLLVADTEADQQKEKVSCHPNATLCAKDFVLH
jgi:hypothetical protein